MGTNTGETLRAVVFIEVVGADGQIAKQPRDAGYAKRVGEKLYVNMQMIPVPGMGWDGTILIEKKQPRDPQAAPQNPQSRRRS